MISDRANERRARRTGAAGVVSGVAVVALMLAGGCKGGDEKGGEKGGEKGAAGEAPQTAPTTQATKADPAPKPTGSEADAPPPTPPNGHGAHAGHDHAGHDHAGHGHAGHGHTGHDHAAHAPPTPPPGTEGVRFLWPADGSTVFEGFEVVMGVAGKTVTPAGEALDDKSRGHHHLIIDGEPIPAGQVVPADARHIHYGGGQTVTDFKLTPGEHRLTLQFADGAHISFGPEWSSTIKLKVLAAPAAPARVFFLEPKDGATVKPTFKMRFGLEGMGLRPAGEDVLDLTTGHHHVIVDGSPTPLAQVVPADETHIHYGKAQTEAELTLAPGKHTLTLQFADGAHRSYGPSMSQTITVTVAE